MSELCFPGNASNIFIYIYRTFEHGQDSGCVAQIIDLNLESIRIT